MARSLLHHLFHLGGKESKGKEDKGEGKGYEIGLDDQALSSGCFLPLVMHPHPPPFSSWSLGSLVHAGMFQAAVAVAAHPARSMDRSTYAIDPVRDLDRILDVLGSGLEAGVGVKRAC
jgi:hypothetical protein